MVVMISSGIVRCARIFQAGKLVEIQTLLPEFAIQAPNEGILGQFGLLNECSLTPMTDGDGGDNDRAVNGCLVDPGDPAVLTTVAAARTVVAGAVFGKGCSGLLRPIRIGSVDPAYEFVWFSGVSFGGTVAVGVGAS